MIAKSHADSSPKADEAKNEYKGIKQIGDHLVDNIEGRVLWLELLLRINQALPARRSQAGSPPKNVRYRNELHITSLECQQVDDVSKWFDWAKKWYEAGPAPAAMAGPAPRQAKAGAKSIGRESGPSGPGWIVQITGHHYHNASTNDKNYDQGPKFVRNTLIKNLASRTIELPGEKR